MGEEGSGKEMEVKSKKEGEGEEEEEREEKRKEEDGGRKWCRGLGQGTCVPSSSLTPEPKMKSMIQKTLGERPKYKYLFVVTT